MLRSGSLVLEGAFQNMYFWAQNLLELWSSTGVLCIALSSLLQSLGTFQAV